MKLRSGTVITYRIHDDMAACAICMDIKYLPVRLSSCGHTFCKPCICTLTAKSIKVTLQCPLCRCEIEDCKHDIYLKRKLKKAHPHEYKNLKMLQNQNLKKYILPTKSNLPLIRRHAINNLVIRFMRLFPRSS